jgi:hypothetical protein
LAYLLHSSLVSDIALEIHELFGCGARENIYFVYERDMHLNVCCIVIPT